VTNLVEEVMRQGYSVSDLRKILGKTHCACFGQQLASKRRLVAILYPKGLGKYRSLLESFHELDRSMEKR
jgi:hypothetical protein